MRIIYHYFLLEKLKCNWLQCAKKEERKKKRKKKRNKERSKERNIKEKKSKEINKERKKHKRKERKKKVRKKEATEDNDHKLTNLGPFEVAIISVCVGPQFTPKAFKTSTQ